MRCGFSHGEHRGGPSEPARLPFTYLSHVMSVARSYEYGSAQRGMVDITEIFDPTARLSALPKVQTNIRWERPVDARLSQLVEMLLLEGESVSRGELVASLVLAAPEDAPALTVLLRSYRRGTVADSIIGDLPALLETARRPGPKTIRGQS